jgi:hypothetical protein
MTHPDDRLADYVDGTLAPAERSEVDAHLATCSRCREEVRLAASAVGALGSLRGPVEVPAELGSAAIAAARSRTTGPAVAEGPTGPPRATPAAAAPGVARWSRWVGAAAAAAAVVIAVAVAAPTLTGDGVEDRAEMATGGEAAPEDAGGTAESAVERIPGNLSAADLPSLVDTVRDATPTPLSGETATEPDAAPSPTEAGGNQPTELPAKAAQAEECLRTAFPSAGTQLLRLFEIRFEGTPAYAGVYFRPASDDVAYDTFRVVAAGRADCSILSVSALRA